MKFIKIVVFVFLYLVLLTVIWGFPGFASEYSTNSYIGIVLNELRNAYFFNVYLMLPVILLLKFKSFKNHKIVKRVIVIVIIILIFIPTYTFINRMHLWSFALSDAQGFHIRDYMIVIGTIDQPPLIIVDLATDNPNRREMQAQIDQRIQQQQKSLAHYSIDQVGVATAYSYFAIEGGQVLLPDANTESDYYPQNGEIIDMSINIGPGS